MKSQKQLQMEKINEFIPLFPELICFKISQEASKKNLIVNRSLKDFSNQRKHNSANNIIIGEYEGQIKALKCYFLTGNTSQVSDTYIILIKLVWKRNINFK